MKTVSLSGSSRENVGSKDAKILRSEGRVPGVIYGNGGNIHFHVKETDFNKITNTPAVNFINLELEGKEYKTIIQELQFHPVTDRAVHFDLLAVAEDKAITIALPVVIEGSSPGVMQGGKLRVNHRKIKVNGLPGSLPETITLNIGDLKIGDTIRLGEVNIEGVTCVGDMREVIVSVKTSRAVVEVEEEDAPAAEGEAAEA